MNTELLQEVLRQARAAADEGRAQLQAELQNALKHFKDKYNRSDSSK